MALENSPAVSQPVLGLLGAPGAGKSTVARAFASLGCAVIDADGIARDVLARDQTLEALRAWWGDQVVTPRGEPDRRAIAGIVFEDPQQRQRLESLVHPQVHAERDRQRADLRTDPGVVAIIEDCPLLLEKQLESVCDVLVYIDAPREQRLARLARVRGWDDAELTRREKSQVRLDIKRSRADYVIDNSDGADLLGQTRHLLNVILQDRS